MASKIFVTPNITPTTYVASYMKNIMYVTSYVHGIAIASYMAMYLQFSVLHKKKSKTVNWLVIKHQLVIHWF